MNVLAFDTSFSACSAAVGVELGGTAARVTSDIQLLETGHAEALMPMIDRVMREASVSFADLDRIILTNGPGSFTGVRTGVAAARAFALATSAEVVAVSSLWAIAMAALQNAGQAPGFDAVLTVMDARKGQLYAQVVDTAGGELTEPLLLDPNAAAALLPDLRLLAVGTGTPAVIAAITDRSTHLLATPAATALQPDARYLLRAATRSSMTSPVLPLYLRPPDAKPQADKSLPWSST